MDAKDLMVGDWVRIIDDDTDAYFDARVEGIDMVGNIYVKVPGGEKVRSYSADYVEPIPITQKILEMNGFSYTKPETTTMSEDNVWRIKDDDKQVLIEIEEQMDDNLLRYYIGYFTHGVNSCEIYFKHVHELQHALRLCGIDKTIEL